MRVLVNGVETNHYDPNSIRISNGVGRRSTGSITFLRKDGFTIRSGERVDIYDDDGDHIFGGFAKRPRLRFINTKGVAEIQVQLVDNTDILQRRIVAETYVDALDFEIIRDIHARYLAEEGIKLGVIVSNSSDVTTETNIETTKTDFTSGVLAGVEVDEGGTMTLENISDNPPLSRIVEDFADKTYNFDFDGTWYRSSFKAYEGIYGFRSANIDDREESITTFHVTVRDGAIGKLSFFYWVSSEPNGDFFKVYVNQTQEVLRTSGVDETWRYFSVQLPPGEHEIALIFKKDRSVSRGYDCAVIDKIVFEEWEGLVYPPQGERIAPKLTSTSDVIKTVRIEWDGETPEGTSVEFYYSLDNQETWELATDNIIRRSVNGAEGLDIKAVLKTIDTSKTPVVREIRYVLETTSGTTIRKAVFNYVTAAQAMDELCELSGATWWVTADKVLHYVSRDEFIAPWHITQDHAPIRSLEVETDLYEYRNRQYVRAGQDTTDLQVENMKGDGSSRTFTVGYKIAQRPVVKVNGVEQTVGIRQVDKNKAFYWARGEKEITQDERQTPLSSTDTLTVEYYGYYPIVVVSEDQNAIEAMMERTGDTGLYENIEEDTNIDSSELALELAIGKLKKYAKINTQVTFETIQKGLQAGQLIHIDLPNYDLSGDFLITSVETRCEARKVLFYTVTAVDGDDVGGWENFFKQLARSQKTYVIRENEVLIRLATQAEQFGLSEEMSYTNYACQVPSTNLYPSNTFYPC